MSVFLDSYSACEAQIEDAQHLRLLQDATFPKGNLVAAFCPSGSVAVMQESEVPNFVSAMISEAFGKFNSTHIAHLQFRTWLYGNVCPCKADGLEIALVPCKDTILLDSGNKVKVYIQRDGQIEQESYSSALPFGSFQAPLKDDGSLMLPESFAQFLGDSPHAFSSLSGDSVWLVPDESALNAWIEQIFKDKFESADLDSPQHRMLKNSLLNKAMRAFINGDYVLGVPSELAGLPRIEDEAVIVGVGDHIEIYSTDRWEQIWSEFLR